MTVIIAANTIKYSSDAEATTQNTTYIQVKSLTMTSAYTGSWRIIFDLHTSDAGKPAYGRIYKNGIAYGTEQTTNSITYVTKSEDFSSLSIAANDTIELWVTIPPVANTVSVQNFRVEFNIVDTSGMFSIF